MLHPFLIFTIVICITVVAMFLIANISDYSKRELEVKTSNEFFRREKNRLEKENEELKEKIQKFENFLTKSMEN